MPIPVSARAVISDLDGTLLRSDGTIGPATVAAIEKLHQAGIPFIVATARTPAGLSVLERVESLVAVAVCCNGSIGHVPETSQLLWRSTVDIQARQQIIAALERHLPDAGVGAYDGEQWLLDATYVRARARLPRGIIRVATRQDIVATAACTLAVRDPVLTSAEIAAELRRVGIGPDLATLSFAGPEVLDITSPGADKASGIVRALEILDVDPRDAMAVGDAPNDVPMFAVVGQSVAVANAHPDVLASAMHITVSNDDNGVAHIINSIHAE